MQLLKQVRQKLIGLLWENYKQSIQQAALISDYLTKERHCNIVLDHLAIIDLPGPNTGISHLCQIFSALGFMVQGRDYLPEKQNEFLWMAEMDAIAKPAAQVLPQVVLADFCLAELPTAIRKIIYKYANQAKPSPITAIQKLCGRIFLADAEAVNPLMKLLTTYFLDRAWPLPALKEFAAVHEFNELLAWTLVFGRIPNHFTIAVHLLKNQFSHLAAFNESISHHLKLPLNYQGGIIKGSSRLGIEQSSTLGLPIQVPLANGTITLPSRFVEFVWRYPLKTKPSHWDDYYTGFIPQNANHVIESLYNKTSKHK